MKNFNTLQQYINAEDSKRKSIKNATILNSMNQYGKKLPKLERDINLVGYFNLTIDNEVIVSKYPTKLLKIIIERDYTSLYFGCLDTLLPAHYIDHLEDSEYEAFMDTVERIMKVCS